MSTATRARRLIAVAVATVVSFPALVLSASLLDAGVAGAEQTGVGCFHIANGSNGFAPTSGLAVKNIKADSADLEINYYKGLTCPLPGYIRYYWGLKYYDNQKADDLLGVRYEGFPVYATGGDYVTKTVHMTNIDASDLRGTNYEVRPDSEIHVVVKLGYAGSTYLVRIGFHTPKDPATGLRLKVDRVTKGSITVTPEMNASRYGSSYAGVDIKSGSSSVGWPIWRAHL